MKFNFVSPFILLSFLILLNSCNVYKSAGRKNLESLGPPPGSIKTSSLASKAQVLYLGPNENFMGDEAFYQICRLVDYESHHCSENLICTRASADVKSSLSEKTAQDIEYIDSNLLLDQNDPKMLFDFALVCKRL